MALTAQAPPPAAWSRWPQHHPNGDYVMIDPGVVPYVSRPTTSAPLQRPMMAQNFFPGPSYTTAPTPSMPVPQYLPGLPPVTYDGYAPFAPSAPPPALGSPFKHERYMERPQLRVISYRADYNRGNGTQDGTESRSPSASIKSEPRTMSVASKQSRTTSPTTVSSSLPSNEAPEVHFNTHVDALMKAIQSKSEEESENLTTESEHVAQEQHWDIKMEMLSHPQPSLRPNPQDQMQLPQTPRAAWTQARAEQKARRFRCDFTGCNKLFTQKTHLDTHIRSHTGEQPYVCTLGCGKRFSQHGNQKIHERRHTGEKPYECTTCGKRFPQHGTLMAHGISHSKAKPYLCKLDNCNKKFTQRGNLKSHQNKFHGETLEALIKKFATVTPSEVSNQDRELWEYFANLYKNSNKGIKGRGKHHRVKLLTPSTPASPAAPQFYSLSQPLPQMHHTSHGFHHPLPYHGTTHLASFSLSRPPYMGGTHHTRDAHGQAYDMFEGEDDSVIGSGSSTTAYDEDHSRELAFGDRMY